MEAIIEKVNESTLLYDNEVYKATPTTATFRRCEGCAFETKSAYFCADNCKILNCSGKYRQDNKDIIWEIYIL